MTLSHAEDIAKQLRERAAWRPPVAGGDLLRDAAEAIDYLLGQLADAEGYSDWLELP